MYELYYSGAIRELKFEREGKNHIIGLSLNDGCVKNLKINRK